MGTTNSVTLNAVFDDSAVDSGGPSASALVQQQRAAGRRVAGNAAPITLFLSSGILRVAVGDCPPTPNHHLGLGSILIVFGMLGLVAFRRPLAHALGIAAHHRDAH